MLAQGFLCIYLNQLEEAKKKRETLKKNKRSRTAIFLLPNWRKNFMMLMGTRFYERKEKKEEKIGNNNNKTC